MGVMVASMHLATATSTPAELLHPPARSVLHGSVHHLPSAPWPTHTLSPSKTKGVELVRFQSWASFFPSLFPALAVKR